MRQEPAESPWIDTIRSPDPARREVPIEALAARHATADLLDVLRDLEALRTGGANLYESVRAALFEHWILRYRLQEAPDLPAGGVLPARAWRAFLDRRHEEAMAVLREEIARRGPDGMLASAMAGVAYRLAFRTLAEQVRASVHASDGNRWMFEASRVEDHPLRVVDEVKDGAVIVERTPVRLDLSHSGWSDIFFLAMDAPEAARVVNISVDLGVHGRDAAVAPPVEVRVRAIDAPVIRLRSVDLRADTELRSISDAFDFGRDYLGLLRAGVLASGLVPPSLEACAPPDSLAALLATVVGPGHGLESHGLESRGLESHGLESRGLEIETRVRDIPKGSRLAVSTTLLASIVAALMRATGQTASLEGPLRESERRLAASRAILGEWLGGSGGGWQDSGGLWPGVKVIAGEPARPGDPEYGTSRGRLLPSHRLLGGDDLHPELAERLAASLVPVHGGMAQDVGPILEMVTERHLLRSAAATAARHEMREIFDGIAGCLRSGDVRRLAALTTRNFEGPLRAVLPFVTNAFTEAVIARARARLGDGFHGFVMLGGMSGGGMGFFVDPGRRDLLRDELHAILLETKREFEDALPFAMDPVVYDFAINRSGSAAALERCESGLVQRATPSVASATATDAKHESLDAWKARLGFDPVRHERLRARLLAGEIGLTQNRLPREARLEDPGSEGVLDPRLQPSSRVGAWRAEGERAIRRGEVAVLTLAGGLGTRWTGGAGVVKALHPFVAIAGRHRSFLEIQLAKTARAARAYGTPIAHLVTTSFLTHRAIESRSEALARDLGDGVVDLRLSPGRSVGARFVPRTRDLEYLWREMPEEALDEPKQRLRDSTRGALLDWARGCGEGADYTDNLPEQCLHPPGHWWEVANLLRGDALRELLRDHPHVRTLLLHNVDTLGVTLDPVLLGAHRDLEAALTFEVVPRRFGDRGGGLARVDGRLRIVEELAQPREDDDLRLRWYNSMTTWIEVDALLGAFGLRRADLAARGGDRTHIDDRPHIDAAVRAVAQRLPTYCTIKDVKRRWGHAQEDVFPVAQFETLWSDMTTLRDVTCSFLAVDRRRGQQLKSPEQLDGWMRDGSLAAVAASAYGA